VRLARYLFEELWGTVFPNPPKVLRSKVFNSLIVVAGFLVLTLTNAYLKIWPIFGAANQLLAALTLIAVTAWLAHKAKKFWFTALPAAFMVITTLTALLFLLMRYVNLKSWTLLTTDIILLLLALGVVVMTFRFFYRLRGELAAVELRGK